MRKKSRRTRARIEPTISVAHLTGKRRGGLLKEEVWQQGGEVVKYNLVYINPAVCSKDNGRVLGYDSSHGVHHRHFMGQMEPIEFPGYEALIERFESEVRELWRKEDEQGY